MSSYTNFQPSTSSMASKPRGRISRTATQNTDTGSGFTGIDAQSILTLDQLSTAKASVTMLDKLWTQIDVLDDVKTMADEVKARGSFFSENFTGQLMLLKESQQRLLEVMAKHTERSDLSREQRRNGARETIETGEFSAEAVQKESEETKKRMHEFFFGQSKDDDNPQRRDMEELSEYVGDVRQHMKDVGEQMKKFDEEIKKIW